MLSFVYLSVADQRIFNAGRSAIDSVSAPSLFIANAHYELYAFYTGKSDSRKLLKRAGEVTPTAPPSFESATGIFHFRHHGPYNVQTQN